MNNTADTIYIDGFPHGTIDGYLRGCVGMLACPNHGTDQLTCIEINGLNKTDFSYRKLYQRDPTAAASRAWRDHLEAPTAPDAVAAMIVPPAEPDPEPELVNVNPPTSHSDTPEDPDTGSRSAEPTPSTRGASAERRDLDRKARAWAKEHGYKPGKGFVQREILDAYLASTTDDTTTPPAGPNSTQADLASAEVDSIDSGPTRPVTPTDHVEPGTPVLADTEEADEAEGMDDARPVDPDPNTPSGPRAPVLVASIIDLGWDETGTEGAALEQPAHNHQDVDDAEIDDVSELTRLRVQADQLQHAGEKLLTELDTTTEDLMRTRDALEKSRRRETELMALNDALAADRAAFDHLVPTRAIADELERRAAGTDDDAYLELITVVNGAESTQDISTALAAGTLDIRIYLGPVNDAGRRALTLRVTA